VSDVIMLRARALVERHLTANLVSNLRRAAVLKSTSLNLKVNELIAVIKVDEDDDAHWAVEQRFGFPYQEIADRDVRRVVWGALEAADEFFELRIVFLDMKNNHASSLRIVAHEAPAS
jgi:hypothetical protein